MEVLLLAVMAASNILCFMIGARVGQKVVKGEEVKLPSVDPLKSYREQQDRKEAQKEQDMVEAILRNVEAYNGTAEGQKDLPRG